AQSLHDTVALRNVCKVGFGQNDSVGDGRLLDRFCMRVERWLAVYRVDCLYNAIEPVAEQKIGMGHGCVQDRRWIGQSGCLKEHTPEFAAAVVEVAQQRFKRI